MSLEYTLKNLAEQQRYHHHTASSKHLEEFRDLLAQSGPKDFRWKFGKIARKIVRHYHESWNLLNSRVLKDISYAVGDSTDFKPISMICPSRELECYLNDCISFPSDIYVMEAIPQIEDIFLTWTFKLKINLSKYDQTIFTSDQLRLEARIRNQH